MITYIIGLMWNMQASNLIFKIGLGYLELIQNWAEKSGENLKGVLINAKDQKIRNKTNLYNFSLVSCDIFVISIIIQSWKSKKSGVLIFSLKTKTYVIQTY